MKKYRILKDTPFHRVGDNITEDILIETYNKNKYLQPDCNDEEIFRFWSYFEEVKTIRFTMDNFPELFIFEGIIYEYNGLVYECSDSSVVWYKGKKENTISKPELLNKVNNSISNVYIITKHKG